MRLSVAPFLCCLLAHASSCYATTPGKTLEYDVVIIGGGSSGSYSAVRLQQLGKSVALIEKENRLGGHTNTYVDPSTGKTFDYGVQVLVNTTIVRNFFNSLNIPLGPFAPKGGAVAVDIAHSTPGPAWPVTNATASASALEKYKVQLAKYPNLFLGYHLPDPVTEDLLIPWGEFLKKYELGPLAYDGFLQFQGMGNILAQPTLYMMKLFNPTQVQAREQKSKVSEANGDTQALWNAAQQALGANAILQSTVLKVDRSAEGVKVAISTPKGKRVIKAKKILMTIPPKLDLLAPFFDLTVEETQLFKQFNNSYYFNAVVANTNFPNMTSVYNYDNHATFGIPALPGPYYYTATGISQLYAVQYSSPYFQSDAQVQSNILTDVSRAREALQIAAPAEPSKILAFNNHSPFGLTVCPEAIKSGFYQRLTALEGPKNTFWTGNSWTSGSSSIIWDFTENEILPAILAAL